MKRENTEKGSVTIEAAIILPIFCALFMALNGFFFVFNAQNQIAHALVQSATSLGMDSYANNQIASGLDGPTASGVASVMLFKTATEDFFPANTFPALMTGIREAKKVWAPPWVWEMMMPKDVL